jgi:anti-anti-sigma factor
MNKGDKHFVLNLEKVTFIDSSAVGWFIRLKKQSMPFGGDLKLLKPPEFIIRLLNMLKLQKYLEIYNDEKRALESFKKNCPICEKQIDLYDSFCRYCGSKV